MPNRLITKNSKAALMLRQYADYVEALDDKITQVVVVANSVNSESLEDKTSGASWPQLSDVEAIITLMDGILRIVDTSKPSETRVAFAPEPAEKLN